ncbi:unnamed protein product [Dibothriocephalus latus]|uniref:PH domain-containing protein n=1 Tax=Dibothriocephalus latus TaxID=60516 RepID=A0A3P7LVV0_DIBLA|nr:unnamed protein product [Dibothriocephalus latus]
MEHEYILTAKSTQICGASVKRLPFRTPLEKPVVVVFSDNLHYVISFADIIDVYPDHKARSGHSSSFCLLLMANTSLCVEPIAEGTYSPAQSARGRIQTRVLSLAAPSPEAMRVWVDALFTCAGAYLCLPSRSQWPGS